MKRLFLIALATLFVGCSGTHAPLATVTNVKIEKYLGTWYEIARYEHSFEKGCQNVTASYMLQEDDKIKVINKCFKNGELTTAQGVAYATDNTYAKLRVSFFRPFYGDYQILMLGEQYEYAVIGEPSREYFWILSRTKELPKEKIESILATIPSLGYDASKLIWTPQN